MSKKFSEWMDKRNKFIIESIENSKKEPTTVGPQSISEMIISGDTLMIAYELDRLCDILERKGR